MPRLSITLTESQSAALERIAAETGATKQSMIGLAVTAWIRANDVQPPTATETTPEPTDTTAEDATDEGEQGERWFTVTREGAEVAWLRGRWETSERRAIIASAMRPSGAAAPMELSRAWRYELQEGDTVRES